MLKTMISSIVTKHMRKHLIDAVIKEEDITEVLKEIRISLLEADVNLFVVKNFIKNVRQQAVGLQIEKNQDPQQVLITIIKKELINILGQAKSDLSFSSKTDHLMLVGLQGSGKTTSVAKIAFLAKKKYNKKPLLVGLDIYRPAAIEQLKTLAKENDFGFFAKPEQKPSKTAMEAIDYAKANQYDLIIYDTAGRLQTNEALMNELKEIKKAISPNEIIFVADAMSGQDMINVAKEFHDQLKLTAILISKLDSDARAGVALSLCSLLNVSIKLTGSGEKVHRLDVFYPERMADRILGLGDIATLAEKAVEAFDEKKTKNSVMRMLSGKFDLEDLLWQMNQMKKMGSFDSIMKMMPNFNNKILSNLNPEEIEQRTKIWEVILNSMTKKERRNPQLFKKSATRRIRVIKGSGRSSDEFNKLMKQYEKAKESIAQIANNIKKGKNPFSMFH